MKNTRIAFFGTPEFAVPILQGLIDNYEVVLVVTQSDKKVGRQQILTPSPIKSLAIKNNIKVITPAKIRQDFEEVIKTDLDLIITCAYGQIIPKEILDYPRLGCINVHASLLPKYRGGAPIHHAVMNGEKETGITIMYMDEKMDNGDIISQEKITIAETDNTGIVHDKLKLLGNKLLLDTLPAIINQTNKRSAQNSELVTFAPIIKREDEKLDFTKSTIELVNQVRGLSPWPLSYLLIDEVEVKILEASGINNEDEITTGTIIMVNNDGLYIKTIDGALVVKRIKISGKKEMNIKEYLNGISKELLIGKIVK